jgi:hypothetical protein
MRADWIDGFMSHTENISSPPLFRKWGAIATVAGALERKVWVRSLGSRLFPNMYTVLVAPPGVGKTEITWRIRKLWEGLEDHHIASTSVTKASLIDELADANRRWVDAKAADPVTHFNSLLMCINELGVLLPAYENEFMNTLTDLWDCKHYSERRRTSKIEIDIDNPQLNLVAACTPSYLMHVLPEGAWDQGFLSRTMLVYSGDRQLRSLFAESAFDEEEFNSLRDGLMDIANLFGEMRFEKAAAEAMDNFHLTDGEPRPDHPKLLSYNIRRTVHMLKLCIVFSVSRSDQLVVTLEDWQRAYDALIEVELHMPDIFKAMSQGGAGKTMEEAWHFIFTTHAKEGKPVLKHRLINFLQERVPVHNIQTTIDMMEQGKMIEKRLTPGGEAYVPRGRKAGGG